jgi:hypothetical protein
LPGGVAVRDTPMPVSFKGLLEAYELGDIGSGGSQIECILCRQTGKIYWHSEFPNFEELKDELPDDIDDDEKYIAVPDKRGLDLGKPLVLDFALEFLPDDFDEVRRIFSKRGAYQKFKALLVCRNLLDRWYDLEAKATEQALRDWCEVNEIELTD